MKKATPGTKEETYFDSLKKKLLNHKLVVYVIMFTIIVSGMAIFVGNLTQIGKAVLPAKTVNSETGEVAGKDSHANKILSASTKDTSTSDKSEDVADSSKKAASNQEFESPPTLIFIDPQKQDNPDLTVASIKIQPNIAWSEIVFAREEKKKIMLIKNSDDAPFEEVMAYRIYDADHLKRADQIFELGRYKQQIDPCFDITLFNRGQSSQIITRIGLEIIEAYYTTISLGSIETRKVEVMGKYKLKFPAPAKIDIDGDIINLKQNRLKLYSEGNWMDIGRNNGDDTTAVKTSTGKLIDYGEVSMALNFSYADLPKTVMMNLNNPIYVKQDEPFRFLLQIEDSRYIPTHTLVRFVFVTDKGTRLTKPIYLLKP